MRKKKTPVKGGILEQARQVNRDEKELQRTGRGNVRREILMEAEATEDFDKKEVKAITKESRHPGWLEDMRSVSWLQEHFADAEPDRGIMMVKLIQYLRAQPEAHKEKAVILPNYDYFGTTLDVVALYKNRVIEFAVINTVAHLQTEMNKLVISGIVKGRRVKANKHHWLAQGKLAQSQVYFVVPVGFVKDMKAIPPHVGVMDVAVTGPGGDFVFGMVKEAHAVHDKYITTDFTRSVLNEVYSRGLQLQADLNSRQQSPRQTWER